MAAREVAFQSIDVANDAGGLDALVELGLRTVPVVARGKDYVFGQSLRDVANFLGLSDDLNKVLPPGELVQRMELIMACAGRLMRQFPDANIHDKLPNRDRSYLELGHHVFVIIDGFFDVAAGAKLTVERLALAPPAEMGVGGDVADFGQVVRDKLVGWCSQAQANENFSRKVETYYGDQPLHEVMERSTWHAAQHVRQLAMVLETLGITPDGPLGEAELVGLPLPEEVWDD